MKALFVVAAIVIFAIAACNNPVVGVLWFFACCIGPTIVDSLIKAST